MVKSTKRWTRWLWANILCNSISMGTNRSFVNGHNRRIPGWFNPIGTRYLGRLYGPCTSRVRLRLKTLSRKVCHQWWIHQIRAWHRTQVPNGTPRQHECPETAYRTGYDDHFHCPSWSNLYFSQATVRGIARQLQARKGILPVVVTILDSDLENKEYDQSAACSTLKKLQEMAFSISDKWVVILNIPGGLRKMEASAYVETALKQVHVGRYDSQRSTKGAIKIEKSPYKPMDIMTPEMKTYLENPVAKVLYNGFVCAKGRTKAMTAQTRWSPFREYSRLG